RFTVTDTDAAGNISAVSTPLVITVDSSTSPTQPPPSANIVNNGGFETGTLASWTVGSYQPEQTLITTNSHSGSKAVALGPAGADGSISQVLATTPGQAYTLGFWLANMSTATNDFSVEWGGTTLMSVVNAPAQGYTEYQFTVTATGTSTSLEFNYRQDPT